MRLFMLGFCVLTGIFPRAIAAPRPESVAVLYNSALPESLELAEYYSQARGIPPENLVGLKMPITPDISRSDYEATIAMPLRREFDTRGWWSRGRDPSGVTMPQVNDMRVLVCMRGVPLRILPTPPPPPPPAAPDSPPPPPPQDPLTGRHEASVDSELAMFGVDGLPTEKALQNRYFKSDQKIADAKMPFLILTARIDAASLATCQRMISDAIETEKTGLWGMTYVDIANKFPQGDQWLETSATASSRAGVPTVIDRFNETLPLNYPMTEASVYYGWYDWHVNGPFLNPLFKFRKGAVAVHLHSFSAEQLHNPKQNWCAPLLEQGAAVTLGNVFEPYLHLTHDLGLLHQRLLAGHSWVEACWMAMPVTSWQGVILGDPLYQPYKHLAGTGTLQKQDREFRALRAATLQWAKNPSERSSQIEKAAVRLNSGLLHEALGLHQLEQKMPVEAAHHFRKAKAAYTQATDRMRQDFHLITIDRAANRRDLALLSLRDAQTIYGPILEAESLAAWIKILDPPPPPAPPNSAPKP